jgi:hypothetical protein
MVRIKMANSGGMAAGFPCGCVPMVCPLNAEDLTLDGTGILRLKLRLIKPN